MFERKNHSILSEHYSKLIDHEPDNSDDNGDDFITLKRANHDLSDDGPLDPSNLSKRKLKMGNAKRAIMNNGLGKKLVFDEEGNAHELYEMADPEKLFQEKGGLDGVKAEGYKFAEGERGRMRVADVVDKEEAREKKQEKKRKRKEKKKAVSRCFQYLREIWHC
jgi:ATP-dependent RNA helicase DDX10/DBP4